MRKQIEQLKANAKRYSSMDSKRRITWCDGCGNYGIQNALKRGVANEQLGVNDVQFCFDIGCSGNGSDKIEGYTAHGLHGRVLPFAAGAAIANTNMQVVAQAGDGATLSEGVNHLIHAIRNNFNMLFILHNNEIYGLTTGQASSTTRIGCGVKGTNGPTNMMPLNAMQLALSVKPSFVARSYSGDIDHMTAMMQAGLQHNGFALLEIFQACPTYNKATPAGWYDERIVDVATVDNYDVNDIWQARKAVENMEENIHVGILHNHPNSKPFLGSQPQRANSTSSLVEEVQHYPVGALYQS